MEVAGSELVHANGEVKVEESVSNPHEKDKGEVHSGKGVTEPIKFGSQGAKTEGDNISNPDFPKDAADEWPAQQQIHSFYLVKYRSYDDPNLKDKIDQADREIGKRNHQRFQILEGLKAKRSDRAQIIEQLKSLGQENKQYRAAVDEKINEMKPLKEALGSLRGSNNAGREKGVVLCSSEEELNNLIQSLNYRMQHEVISLTEEKQLIREIKQLEGTREKVIANAAMRAKIQDSVGQKEAIQDQVKNACFYQNRSLLNNAKELAAKKNVEGLNELACAEVEKFMSSWNSSRSFRDDYEKRILASLDIRQLSRDGRMRNPNEKPLVLAEQTKLAEAETLAKATPKPAKEDPKSAKKQEKVPAQNAQKESKKKQGEPKTAPKPHDEDEEEYYVVELPKKETSKQNVIDEAKLKEIKRQEEMEKQKQALERKEKLAKKAAGKATVRAQKEAEKKQKEREKKMKKKESASALLCNQEEATETETDAAEAEKFEKVEESVETTMSGKTKEVKDTSTTIRYRGRNKGRDALPKAILKRKKLNKYLYWAAPAAAVVLVLLALLYNYAL